MHAIAGCRGAGGQGNAELLMFKPVAAHQPTQLLSLEELIRCATTVDGLGDSLWRSTKRDTYCIIKHKYEF
jgi:hypothetical protein